MNTFQKKIVFIHIPKSSGTSARQFFIDAYGESSVAWMGYDFSRDDLIDGDPDFFNRHKVIGGHFSFKLAQKIPGEKIYIAVYRNVVDRIISLYRYIERTNHHHLHDEVTAAGLKRAIKEIPSFRAQVSNLQIKFLSDSTSPPSFKNAQNNIINNGFYISSIDSVQELFDTLKRDLALPNTLKYGLENKSSHPTAVDPLLKNSSLVNDLLDLNSEDLKFIDFLDAKKRKKPTQEIVVAEKSEALKGPAVVLLHIPKTGGTTLHDIMQNHFNADQICPERLNNLEALDSSSLSRYRFFSGHYDWEGVCSIPANKKIFTLLRNPRERILSLYHFWRSHKTSHIEKHNLGGPRMAKTHNLYDFLCTTTNGIPGNIDNVVARNFTSRAWHKVNGGFLYPDEVIIEKALDIILSLDSVGVLDFSRSSYQQILNTAGFSTPDIFPRARDSRHFSETPSMEVVEKPVVTEEARERLAYLTRLDDKIYEKTLDVFYPAIEPRHSIPFSVNNAECEKWLGDGWFKSTSTYHSCHSSAFVSFRITKSVHQVTFRFIFDGQSVITDDCIIIRNSINGKSFTMEKTGSVKIPLDTSSRKQFEILHFELNFKKEAHSPSLKSWTVDFQPASEHSHREFNTSYICKAQPPKNTKSAYS